MESSRTLQQNTIGSGNRNCLNTINSNNTIHNTTYTDEERQILEWLSPLEPRIRHRDVSTHRCRGLGSWFLRNEEFIKWRDGKDEPSKTTLFCSGNPGVGKTYLSSLVIDTLCDQIERDNIAVAYLYCDFKGQEAQTAANLIGALVKQLVRASETVPPKIDEAFKKTKSNSQVPDVVKLLQAALAPFKRTFICIDALDECPDEALPGLLSALSVVSQGSSGIRLFITGRPPIQGALEKYFPASVGVIPVSPNGDDIREYLAKALEEDLKTGAMNSALKAEIMERIPETVSDAFLLVSLTITAILRERTIHKRREKLEMMTSGGNGLDNAYRETLDRITDNGDGQSKPGLDVLMWISRSERAMTTEELCVALSVEIGSKDINPENIPAVEELLASCLGLVTVDERSTVRLVHFTFQEYLNSHPEHFEDPDSKMAEVCLTYLNYDSINKISPTLDCAPEEVPFLQFASSYWGFFARKGGTEGVKSLTLQLLDGFDRHISARLLFLEQSDEWRYRELTGFTGLHCAAYLALEVIAATLLDVKGWDASMADSFGRTPLLWAAQRGHERIVKLLLERNEVNPDSLDKGGSTPLLLAAGSGHEGVVRLLLDRNEVNPDSPDERGSTPLQLASEYGHEGIVQLLLGRNEVNPDSLNKHGSTPLKSAARNGHEGIAKLLLNRNKVSLDSFGEFHHTPLLLAAQNGHEGIVKLLLGRNEANPDSPNENGSTPLQLAAEMGHEGIVRLLLGRNEVNPDSSDDYLSTPLQLAAQNGHEGIVKLLLGRSEVNPDSSDMSGSTPLLLAAQNGHEGIVQLLLGRNEVNPDSSDGGGSTPLLCAAGMGHEGIAKLLLGRSEVNPDSLTSVGSTPLQVAAMKGHEGIVKLLLDQNAVNPQSSSMNGYTPLLLAAKSGHEGIVNLLLGRNEVNPDSSNNYGSTPLFLAAGEGHEAVVKLLLGRDEVNPDSPDNHGSTPLQFAAYSGHEGIVKLLLDRIEVNPDSPDKDGSTPLQLAAQNGHEGIVELLLGRIEVNPDSSDKDGSTPLQLAARSGHQGIVKLLLRRDEVNHETSSKDGFTPLLLAARKGHDEVVKLLRDRAATKRGTVSLVTRCPPLPRYTADSPNDSMIPQPLLQPRSIAANTSTPGTRGEFPRHPMPPPPSPDTSPKVSEVLPHSPTFLPLPPLKPIPLAAAIATTVAAIAIAWRLCRR